MTLDVKGIFRSSWRFFVANYGKLLPLMGIGALCYVPYLLYFIVLNSLIVQSSVASVGGFQVFLVVVVSVLLLCVPVYMVRVSLALYRSTDCLLKNEGINTKQAWDDAEGKFWRFVRNALLIGLKWWLILILGMIVVLFLTGTLLTAGDTNTIILWPFTAALILAMYLIISAYPFFPLILLERKKGIIKRNAEIRKGNYKQLVYLNAPSLIATLYSVLIGTVGVQLIFYNSIGSILLWVFFFQPLGTVIMTTAYQKLVFKNENGYLPYDPSLKMAQCNEQE